MIAETNKFMVYLLGAIGVVIALIVGGTMWAASATCHARAARMGYPATWSPLEGCMIEVAPNKWVPGSSYRYFLSPQADGET